MLGGDFTPVREPLITFDTLILEDGTRIPIHTSVSAGTATIVEFRGSKRPQSEPPSGPVSPGVQALIDADAHAGHDILKGMLWNLAPYHPRFVPSGMRYRATLSEPLDFGTAILAAGALNEIGATADTGDTVYARLQTPLNSRTTKTGTAITALLTRPLFSRSHLLTFPVGSRLTGEVTHVRPAGKLHHPGEMAFRFTKIETPLSLVSGMRPPREIDGRLTGMQVGADMSQVHIDREGFLHIRESKTRFFSPALAVAGFGLGLNSTAESFGNAFAGAYSGNLINRALTGDAGLGMPAGIVGRMIPTAGLGLGAYNVGYSLFINVFAKGPEINFPANTPIEIRFDEAH
jgi:hypothetical protein